MFVRYGLTHINSVPVLEGLRLISPRFIEIRRRRLFRIGTVIAFLLGIGALATRQSHEHIVMPRKQHLAKAAFAAP
jgi:hypothetical protein